MIDWATFNLLRRHVTDRAHYFAGIGIDSARGNAGLGKVAISGARELGQPKVEDLHAPVVGDEQIIRFEIAMDDPLFMSCGQAMNYLQGIIDSLALWHDGAAHALAQALALKQF